ncbi:MAG: glycosyltransferase [Planctomycetota bacterium]|jgi:glycosyltransferase involved in cell wall biosynthesis|nr:glycosyltransferase [Planctomycetota bacterium]
MILELITELGAGGAERVVFELATRLPQVAVAALDGRGVFADRLRERGVAVYDLGARRKTDVGVVWRLRRLLRELRPRVLHTHLFHANLLGRLAAAGLHIPALSTCHIMETRPRPWHFFLDRLTARLAAGEVCVSQAVADFQRQKTGLPAEFFPVIYNGIDLEKFRPAADREALRRELNFPAAALTVGFLGRLAPQKGVDIFIRAIAALMNLAPELAPQVAWVVGGAGSEERKLRELAADLNLPHILFCGEIAAPEKFLAALDIAVMPSRYEGFGLVAAEAQSCGAAVIAADLPPLREIVADGENGLLTPPDADALAAALQKLSVNPDLRRRLAAAGQQSARRFEVEKMANEYRRLLERTELRVKS